MSLDSTNMKPPCLGSVHPKMKDWRVVIRENHELAPGYWRMRVDAAGLGEAFSPGQFFQFRMNPDGGTPFLRRPFAPSEVDSDGCGFVYAIVGDGTSAMRRLSPGMEAAVLAPLGKPYRLPTAGAGAVLVGGGCGTPSLKPLASTLSRQGNPVLVVLGARSECSLLERKFFSSLPGCRLVVATDDGSLGKAGTVVDALAEEWKASSGGRGEIFACGPMPMLRAVAGFAVTAGVGCQVSLEERMACGFGACVGCVVRVRDGQGGEKYARVCHDGPVFDAAELLWQ